MPALRLLKTLFKQSQGSTLIEVLIATMVVVLVLVALSQSFTLVLRNQRNSMSQQQATKYAQQSLEWVRQVRDTIGWQDFYSAVNADAIAGRTTHCMPTIPATTTLAAYQALTDDAGGCVSTNVIQNEQSQNSYLRKIVVTVVGAGADNIQAVATVSWTNGTTTLDSQITLVLRKWSN